MFIPRLFKTASTWYGSLIQQVISWVRVRFASPPVISLQLSRSYRCPTELVQGHTYVRSQRSGISKAVPTPEHDKLASLWWQQLMRLIYFDFEILIETCYHWQGWDEPTLGAEAPLSRWWKGREMTSSLRRGMDYHSKVMIGGSKDARALRKKQ